MTSFYQAKKTTVVLLAAGHGKRMLPLTETTPKPLLKIGSDTLIEHHLRRLKQQGFEDIVINIAHLAKQIPEHLGSGARYGLRIQYSDESSTGPLETAGGLHNALPLISSNPFLCINADIWTDLDFRSLLTELTVAGRLVVVANPCHNPNGDFAIDNSEMLTSKETANQTKKTYSGVALYKKELFDGLKPGKHALAPIFRQLIAQYQLEGTHYSGVWNDIGTPERLAELNQRYKIS